MKKEEQDNLKNNEATLINMVMSEPEIETIKKEVNKNIEEVKNLACKLQTNLRFIKILRNEYSNEIIAKPTDWVIWSQECLIHVA